MHTGGGICRHFIFYFGDALPAVFLRRRMLLLTGYSMRRRDVESREILIFARESSRRKGERKQWSLCMRWSRKVRVTLLRHASASSRNKAGARALFCPPLRSVTRYRPHEESLRSRIYTYSAYIMYTSSAKTRTGGDGDRRWPWISSLIPSSSRRALFHRSAALRCEIYTRNSLVSLEKGWDGNRERKETGKWKEENDSRVSLSYTRREHDHDVKAKEEHALRPSPFRRLLNVNVWDNS